MWCKVLLCCLLFSLALQPLAKAQTEYEAEEDDVDAEAAAEFKRALNQME